MKVIQHQAVGKCFGNGLDAQAVFLQKEPKVFGLLKNILKTIRMVENMIRGIGLEEMHIFLN
jgi:hypothetical protein